MTSKSGHPLPLTFHPPPCLPYSSPPSSHRPTPTWHWQWDYIWRYASQCNELFSYDANMKTFMFVHTWGKAIQMQRVQKKFCILDIWELIYAFTVRRSLTWVASARTHTARMKVWISTYSITLERIHTAAQNAKRHSDRLEASAFICSFILERSCTHVDSVTNHSLKLKL